MNTRKTIATALAAFAAGGLAACGDDDNGTPNASAPESTPVVVPTTPEGTWAQELCTAMVGKATTVQPPAVNPTSPKETKTALIGFFTDIGEQLDEQVKVVEQVGPPPGTAKADWEKAVDRMRDVNSDIGKIRRDIRRADASSPSDITKVVADLSKQMGALTEYQGPVAELSESKELAAAITAEPACAKVS